MGCKGSTDKSGDGKKGKNEPPDDISTLKSALMDWSDFLDKNCPDHKDPLLKAYLNGCVEVLKIHFHRKADKSVAFVKQVAEELGEPYASAVKVVDEDYCADDGMLRCLIVWLQYDRGEIAGSENASPVGDNTRGSISLEASFAEAVTMSMTQALEELSLPATAHFSSYRELIQLFHDTTQHEELHRVFEDLSEGDQVLSVDAFAGYLRTQGYDKDHQSLAREKIRTCFGGFMTKYNFSSYYSMPRTNSVYDPQRATVVWQDMTQPLTSYFIRTERVDTLKKVKRAVRNGVRCLLFEVKEDEETQSLILVQPNLPEGAGVPFERTETTETAISHQSHHSTPIPEGQQQNGGGKPSSENNSLEDILHWLKIHTFTGPTHSYPMILGFPELMSGLENKVARVCNEVLGDDLAKGLMFEGATIQDPQFTPAALSNKFLLLAQQAALVPFVGFHVADMNRDGLGVKVTDVKEGTPAAKATITKDDWLTHVNGTPIANRKQLKSILSSVVLGQEIDLRKESQETATIVVGGSFSGTPSEMDKAAFLRLVSPEAEPGTPASPAAKNGELAPWECRSLPPEGSPEKVSDNHFGLVPYSSDKEDVIIENEKNGVQMIETSTSAARQWADGKFAENAKCGYVLKRKHIHGEHTMKFSIITRFQKDRSLEVESFEASVFGGDQFMGVDGSITVNTVDELSLLVLKIVTAKKVEQQKNGNGKANSPGKRSNPATPIKKESPPLVGPLAENDPVVREVYTASVPVHMLRKGYHAIPLRTADGKKDSVVCLFERDVQDAEE